MQPEQFRVNGSPCGKSKKLPPREQSVQLGVRPTPGFNAYPVVRSEEITWVRW